MLECKFCNKLCKNDNSLRNHERLCKHNPSRQTTLFHDASFQKTANKHLATGKRRNQYTKARDLGIPEYGKQSVESRLKISNANKLRKHTPETKAKLSKIAKDRGLGGHTSKKKMFFQKKSGEAVYLQSSFEIRFASILEELNIDWDRPDPFTWVDNNGVDHKYYPDFKIGNIYIDTKNDYLAVKDRPKIDAVASQNGIDLRIVVESQITKDYIASIV